MSTPQPSAPPSEAVRKHKEFLFPAVAMYYQEPVALTHGAGAYVWDDAGNRYLDCFGGVLTVSLGHAQPAGLLKVFEETKRRGVLIGKGGLYGSVIRTGMMLNSTKDNVDELIAALDKGFALAG